MRVLFCSSEVAPFAQTGGLGQVCGELPLALAQKGIFVDVILPRYKCVNAAKIPIKKLNKDVSIAKINDKVQVYFVENDELYNRDGLYGDKRGDYPDNLERFSYYSRKTLEIIKQLNIQANIIHCHDWHAALIPVYLKSVYKKDPFYRQIKSILTIHNLAYQGLFERMEFVKLGLPRTLFSVDGLEFYSYINFLKGGIIFSDYLTTVSKRYAKEIQTPEFGCGLEGVVAKRNQQLTGILNGLDSSWNPQTDSFITKNFSSTNIEDKSVNKKKLQKDFKLPIASDVPLFGFVGRLSVQKGLDLLNKSMKEITKLNVQVIILGTGEEKYHRMFEVLAKKYPQKIAVCLKYDETLAHRIYAGSDFFLMPSIYEPCGLSQMISLKYATIPIVFKTGGLADTIVNFNPKDISGNGFVFEKYDVLSFVRCVKSALEIYENKDLFGCLVRKTLTYDFSWDKSAEEYQKLYTQCLSSD